MPHHRRYLLRVLASVILAQVLGIVLGNQAGAAPVTWTFVETSCTSFNGGCQDLSLPQVLAGVRLILPDINSSGSYRFESPEMESGDTDLVFNWDDAIAPVPRGPGPGGACFRAFGGACHLRISFASSPDHLSISIDFLFSQFSDTINLIDGVGSAGSDGFMPGCGEFAFCNITGFWELVGVPEPSSLFDFGIAVTFCGLLLLSLRRSSLQ
jgi:hypothetical protein